MADTLSRIPVSVDFCEDIVLLDISTYASLHKVHLEEVFAQAPALLKVSIKPFQSYTWSKLVVECINSI
ncbi:hypothetical protein [Nostoc sp. NIES-3756]|uniref:hypothetical protein n=1 Tax=Nostoc sp. NIES-3756 TaxID=1751286 RepID=UPI0011DFD5E2|nr:hypothetical protein [Nostoc sp. NIES-3756]